MTPKVQYHSLGRTSYPSALSMQEVFMQQAIDRKKSRRNAGLEGKETSEDLDLALPENHLIFVEHDHVLTLGKTGKVGHVVASEERLRELGVAFYPTNRGGDITYHGPGQLVGYPILDLEQFYTDIGKYMRMLEEAIIRTCADYGIQTGRIPGLTGVWVHPEAGLEAKKIAALGVKCSRWVTMHGFALNIDTDLHFFDLIVPCGIGDRGVTSMSKECGYMVDANDVKQAVLEHLGNLFQWNLIV